MEAKNNYEGLFIIRPELKEEEVKAVFAEITAAINNHSGALTKEEDWGKRALAFPIKKCKEGFYYKVSFQAPPPSVSQVSAMYRLNPKILRLMITKR